MYKDLKISAINKFWKNNIPDCGPTVKKIIDDKKYQTDWLCLYNAKRMERRFLPKQKLSTCLFCTANKQSSNYIASIEGLDLFACQYPIIPLHLLLFNSTHQQDPQLSSIRKVLKFIENTPQLRVILNCRKGSGASMPLHMHFHAFPLQLPIERADVEEVVIDKKITIQQVKFPAWALRITFKDNDIGSLFLYRILKSYRIPFNIAFCNKNIYLIPRRIESPQICKKNVDGVGTMETCGIYTLTEEAALKKISSVTFRKGLSEATFSHDLYFQKRFVLTCKEIICNL